MPVTIMAKNYSHCPLKKRPVQFIVDENDEPNNTDPVDLSTTNRYTTKLEPPYTTKIEPPYTAKIETPYPTKLQTPYTPKLEAPSPPPASPQTTSPVSSPASSPGHDIYQPIPKYGIDMSRPAYPQISPEYAPQTWHRSIAPIYHPHPQFLYPYPSEYMLTSPTGYSDSSCSPPHMPQQPLAPLAVRPSLYTLDQQSLSPSSSTASPPPPIAVEDLSKKQRAGGVRHVCPDCGKSYSTFSGMSKHRQFLCAASDGPRKSFSCKYCDKVYVSLGALKMHIRTHTLPCKCTICNKAFSRPWLLQGHIRTHTGEKPFSCTYCNRAFADRSNLRAHLQTHSDVKKYSCPTCSKTFSRMSLLTKHAEGGCNGLPPTQNMQTDKLY